MAIGKKAGMTGVFWVTFVVFGLLVLIGIFYWMVHQPNPVPHSPEQSSSVIWTEPIARSVRLS
jgi:hypothetical protein